jgi:hypothetical protein
MPRSAITMTFSKAATRPLECVQGDRALGSSTPSSPWAVTFQLPGVSPGSLGAVDLGHQQLGHLDLPRGGQRTSAGLYKDPGAGLKAASRIFFLLGVAGSLAECVGCIVAREEELR